MIMVDCAKEIDTIFALATPPGRGSIAVVRVSGSHAFESFKILTGRNSGFALPHAEEINEPSSPVCFESERFEREGGVKVLEDNYTNNPPKKTEREPPTPPVKLCKISDPVSRETIDHCLVLCFKNPASYTGEDVVEYHLHGGRAVVSGLLRVLGGFAGHRLAEPGEFTRRAFENGKMDLTAAEAVADLIDAETEEQKMQALSQMGGALANLYEEWAGRLTRALAHLEADIDFPDEDMPEGVAAQVWPVLATIQKEILDHLNDNRRGERLRDGIKVAIIGAPNAGKSSLVNVLAGREVAIVSDLAGTTRDVIEAHLDLGGYPVIVADTAGLRPEQLVEDAHGKIEAEGIRRALAWANNADIRVLLFDGSQDQTDPQTMALANENSLIVYNKSDLAENRGIKGLSVSVKTGAGMDQMVQALVEKIKALIGRKTGPTLTRERHRRALEECVGCLEQAQKGALPELVAEDIRLAVRALGRITGRVDVEDLLDVIFRDFCIGK